MAYTDPPLSWLETDDIPAEPLIHLIPEQFSLSVYEIPDKDEDRINQVATAIAAKRNELDTVQYIIFEESILAELGIEIDDTIAGETCDVEVNTWHRELKHFSANKMVALVKRLLPITPADFVPQKTIESIFEEKGKSNKYDSKWISSTLQKKYGLIK